MCRAAEEDRLIVSQELASSGQPVAPSACKVTRICRVTVHARRQPPRGCASQSIDLKTSLRELLVCRNRLHRRCLGGGRVQAEILTQLIRMLVILHNHGLTTSATFPLRYSSLYVSLAAAGDRLGVRWAPWEAPDATGSFMWLADGMCVPPETAAAPSAAVAGEAAEDVDLQKADVWRAAAVVVTTLAAPWLSNGDRKASAWEMLAGLQGRLPSHLAIVLKVRSPAVPLWCGAAGMVAVVLVSPVWRAVWRRQVATRRAPVGLLCCLYVCSPPVRASSSLLVVCCT